MCFVMVHIFLLLHVRFTLQPFISVSLLLMTGILGLPLINKNKNILAVVPVYVFALNFELFPLVDTP